ncbi:hypothetical protein J1N35_007196 [Gossypium stocksii]|uniref:Uncharacterized protein n=1 Tax=Gossypium stocksii TaxID=47602 RepID=A0A9D4AFB7_9ROSI|nr:hypothetical protein J1N35_007196 [Gossypium stocksii]
MFFLFTVLNVAYVMDPNLQPVKDPTPNANSEEITKVAKLKKKREEDNFACQGHIFNTLSDQLYDLYIILHSKCSIMDQVHELQVLVSRLCDLKVVIPELLQVGDIISKLPSSWNNHQKKLLHMANDFIVEKLLMHLCIEEETRKRDAVYLS